MVKCIDTGRGATLADAWCTLSGDHIVQTQPLKEHEARSMKNESEVQFAEPGNLQGDTPASKPVDRHRFLKQVACALAILLLCGESPPLRATAPCNCASS